ncbi:MAG: hypothetical protein ACKVOR_02045 [Flavobacteriales bacterium]
MHHINPSYNEVIKDLAMRLTDLMTETLHAAGHLHLMNTNPDLSKKIIETGSLYVHDEDALLASPDPMVQAIMRTHKDAEKALATLDAYWLTTPNWARGEEI